MRAFTLAGSVCLSLLAGSATAQTQDTPAPETPDVATVPGLEVLAGALEQGGFHDTRLLAEDFLLLESTHSQLGTIYVLISREGGAPIPPSREGEPAPELNSSAPPQ